MSLITDTLAARRLPELPHLADAEENRRLIVDILSEHIYGRTPDFKSDVSAKVTYRHDSCFGGTSKHIHYALTVTTPGGDFTFPLFISYPKSDAKVPLVINIGFEFDTPSGFIPEEEIVRSGVAVARFCYTSVAADNASDGFKSGIAPLFVRDESRTDNWGALGMWAWAASRALDFLLTLGLFDEEKIAVIGHSRLGKTALWCGAQDTRFKYVFSNNAGCSGDSITRGKQGEDVASITKTFPYWFCEKYRDYCGDATAEMPFDQHFLLAAIAPRYVAVGASSQDIWADPESEFLCCHAASPAWERRGLAGFIAPDDHFTEPGECYDDGHVAFHNRHGAHTFCREDWLTYLDFMRKH